MNRRTPRHTINRWNPIIWSDRSAQHSALEVCHRLINHSLRLHTYEPLIVLADFLLVPKTVIVLFAHGCRVVREKYITTLAVILSCYVKVVSSLRCCVGIKCSLPIVLLGSTVKRSQLKLIDI